MWKVEKRAKLVNEAWGERINFEWRERQGGLGAFCALGISVARSVQGYLVVFGGILWFIWMCWEGKTWEDRVGSGVGVGIGRGGGEGVE